MRFGVVFPQTEIGTDPMVIRDFAQTAEELGYQHILAYDHVIGANPASRPGWRPPYTHRDTFHEPFVLFGYLAGLTKKIELVTGVIILPQRQTVLVAKQAAALDVLSGGRLRLGIGIGWNPVEYEALGRKLQKSGPAVRRASRSHAQALDSRASYVQGPVAHDHRRRLEPAADSTAHSDLVRRQRRSRIAPSGTSRRRLVSIAADRTIVAGPRSRKIKSYAREAGRDPSRIGIEGRITFGEGSAESWMKDIDAWKNLGATHLTVNTMKAGLRTPADHIDAIRRFKEASGVKLRIEDVRMRGSTNLSILDPRSSIPVTPSFQYSSLHYGLVIPLT